MKPLVVVFAKPPVPGEVKTRLARELGDDAAAALALAFFTDTWTLLQDLDCEPILASTREDAAARLGVPGATVWQQGEGDLATRLHRIFDRGFQSRDRVIALGADSPGLPREHLSSAFSALEREDAVIGPAHDGGFYLVGLRRCPPRLFHRVALGTDRARATLLTSVREDQLSFCELESWFDVDDARDLKRAHELLIASPERAPQTARALQALEREL